MNAEGFFVLFDLSNVESFWHQVRTAILRETQAKMMKIFSFYARIKNNETSPLFQVDFCKSLRLYRDIPIITVANVTCKHRVSYLPPELAYLQVILLKY